ncbi:peptide chain release factor 2 [Candidatus Hydrogenosomobacter endosymbioticus]|uniref:Peptide chain release factor 2 n=2 Tax=Candidatus Hydrogenosomobacter endosymbioticus TaxID=2558174 RepID=A0ABN6L2J5_9PROT|nr:peptide chain release factor 2 [Candidatus Hydrogenosomobacter endosymbioticus]
MAKLLKRREALVSEEREILDVESALKNSVEIFNMAVDEGENEVADEESRSILSIVDSVRKLRLNTLFSEERDKSCCFVEVQAGAGGTEAQDWAMMLLRMYMRWAQRCGYEVEALDESPGEEAGLKSATIKISGPEHKFPYGWLKHESGVHRLVRISPFDASSRRHTSFASIVVSPEVDDSVEIEINPKDLKIDTYRASGAGGQHVNKTESAIRITHIPSGIVAQCQNDRSQHRNKATAMSMLKSRLYDSQMKKQKEDIAALSNTEKSGISWGRQVRSYVLQPYRLVKDVRSGFESGCPDKILDGELEDILEANLKMHAEQR